MFKSFWNQCPSLRLLLDTLSRDKLVLDWKKKQQTRAAAKLTIADTLEDLPERYTDEM